MSATAFSAAPQHAPRPLPLFLDMLREQTAASPVRRARALTGLRAYQDAERPRPSPLPPAHAEAGRARLLDHGGAGRPVVFVPSLINPPLVLDLAPGNSLVRWLAVQGFHVHLLDWGAPEPGEAALDIAGHVERLLLPLLDTLNAPPVLVGYCLGGTMALAAACLRPIAGLALLAAPWRFAGWGEDGGGALAELWSQAEPACRALGLVPMEVLQAGFWRLDPARTISKYERFGELAPNSAEARAFVALEDWANGGAPLTYAAGRDLFEAFARDDLPGRGEWRVAGEAVEPERLTCPALDIVSTSDRIVPAATAAGLADRRELSAGHVGMVVGSRARAQLWEPLADWLAALPPPT